MRILLKLLLSVALAVILVSLGFSFWQANQEESRLETEVDRRSGLLLDNLETLVAPHLDPASTSGALQVLNRFARHERVVGVVLFDAETHPVLFSEGLADALGASLDDVQKSAAAAAATRLGHGVSLASARGPLRIYSVPITSGDSTVAALSLVNDTAFIRERVNRIWVNNFVRALVQSSLVSALIFGVIYLNFLIPIRKTADWIKRIRLGEPVDRPPFKDEKLFGPLAREVSRMAKSLEMARLAAEKEARLRQNSESTWTPERLKEFIKIKLGPRSLFVVSNREPYMHIRKDKKIEWIVPASGLVTAIEPVLLACGGTWIAQGSGEADRETADARGRIRVPPDEPQYLLRRVWIDREIEEGFYYGFANEGLWPLCHIAHTRPIFREKDWEDYVAANRIFADAVLEELEGAEAPNVLVQDYHFALLPKMIKDRRPDARVAIFWHIPWPNPESFGICPWQRALLEGMLGADLIGFHTQYHCNNFIETIDRFLESRIDYEHFTVNRENHTTWIKPFPISIASIDPAAESVKQNGAAPTVEELLKPHGLQAKFLGVGVDRLDYTKGILERFRSIERFLEKNSSYLGKFTFVELGAPSRSLIPRYQEHVNEIEREAERINERFKRKNWKPILFLKKHHSHRDIYPFYRAADVCLVTSLHDGMNLVAKEYVLARDDERGALVLSQFTGAARELKEALIINPYDIGQTAEAIREALTMSAEEQEGRMRRMREHLSERNVYRWAADLVGELAQIR